MNSQLVLHDTTAAKQTCNYFLIILIFILLPKSEKNKLKSSLVKELVQRINAK